MIRIQGLEKRYGQRKVLQRLDLDFRPGVISALAGPNACGKTTLIKCILGLVIPQHGQIKVQESIVRGNWEYRKKIGYMPQSPDFPENLKVRELFTMLEDLRGEAPVRKDEMIAYFELEPALEQSFGQLSGGTKQKVAAVVAFMFNAPIVILDEPTAGLDPVSTLKFKDLLLEMSKRGTTVLLVSHIMTEIEQLADDLVYLMDGKIVFSGPIEKLKAEAKEVQLERAITQLVLDYSRRGPGL